jgi:hypothetical protein
MRKLLGTLLIAALAVSAQAATVPAAIEGMSLADGTAVRVDPREGSKLTVVVFLSARCPCSASHEPVLAELAREFAPEARFVAIHSNADEPEAESAAHFKAAALPFAVIQDHGSRLADAFGALKTPHVYVISSKGEILFQGGVDDSHDAAKAHRPYLKLALQALKEGHTPEVTLARSLGCQIRR